MEQGRGFTLIEVVIVVAIMSSCILIGGSIIRKYKDVKEKLVVSNIETQIIQQIDFIINDCKNSERGGTIAVINKSREFKFVSQTDQSITYKLPEGYKFEIAEGNITSKLVINSNGLIKNALSFNYVGRDGVRHKLSIKAAGFNIS